MTLCLNKISNSIESKIASDIIGLELGAQVRVFNLKQDTTAISRLPHYSSERSRVSISAIWYCPQAVSGLIRLSIVVEIVDQERLSFIAAKSWLHEFSGSGVVLNWAEFRIQWVAFSVAVEMSQHCSWAAFEMIWWLYDVWYGDETHCELALWKLFRSVSKTLTTCWIMKSRIWL